MILFVIAGGTTYLAFSAYKDYKEPIPHSKNNTTNVDEAINASNVNENNTVQSSSEKVMKEEFIVFKAGIERFTHDYDLLWSEFEAISDQVDLYPNLYSQELIDISSKYQLLSSSVLKETEYMQMSSSYWESIREEVLYPLQEAALARGNAMYAVMRTSTGAEDATHIVVEQMQISNEKMVDAIANLQVLEDEIGYE